MIIENLSTLKINKLTQEQYDAAVENGTAESTALYLTPDTTAEEIEDIRAQVNNVYTIGTFMTRLNVTGDLTDDNFATVKNAAGYDLFLIYIKLNNDNESFAQIMIPSAMIPPSTTGSVLTYWTATDTANSKTFSIRFSGTSLLLQSESYSGNGCKTTPPIVYGIKMVTMTEEENTSTAESLGTAVAEFTVGNSQYAATDASDWGDVVGEIKSGCPYYSGDRYVSKIRLTSPSSIDAHTKLAVAVELNKNSYVSECMAVLSTSEVVPNSILDAYTLDMSTTLSNATIATCNCAKYADGEDYSDKVVEAGKTAYFIFDNVEITADTSYYVYLLPTSNSHSWLSSNDSLVTAKLY